MSRVCPGAGTQYPLKRTVVWLERSTRRPTPSELGLRSRTDPQILCNTCAQAWNGQASPCEKKGVPQREKVWHNGAAFATPGALVLLVVVESHRLVCRFGNLSPEGVGDPSRTGGRMDPGWGWWLESRGGGPSLSQLRPQLGTSHSGVGETMERSRSLWCPGLRQSNRRNGCGFQADLNVVSERAVAQT